MASPVRLALGAALSTSLLLAPAARATAPSAPAGSVVLSPCPVSTPPSALPPPGPPGRGAAVCRATPTTVTKGNRAEGVRADGVPPNGSAGYHHLGAATVGEWSGVAGQLRVRDAGVRAGTWDFVAPRFMAKRMVNGVAKWLEAGWAETGWAGGGRQRIYTFDTNHSSWSFYDQYALTEGMTVHIGIDTDGSTWRAWLWWGDKWNLLTSQHLPLGATALMEQYVEVYIDPKQGGRFAVPRVDVTGVRLKSGGAQLTWSTNEPTHAAESVGSYCVNWATRYDTWSAGDC